MASDPLRVLGDIGRRLINVESKYARRNGSTRKTAQAYAAEALLRDDTDDSESMSDDVPDFGASSDESESADLFDAITDVVSQAYATEGGMAHGSARKPRTLMPVHTPASWHIICCTRANEHPMKPQGHRMPASRSTARSSSAPSSTTKTLMLSSGRARNATCASSQRCVHHTHGPRKGPRTSTRVAPIMGSVPIVAVN